MFYLVHKIAQYYAAHYQACMLSLKNLIRSPVSSLITILAIALSLSLPITSLIALFNIQNLTQHWDEGNTITLYLNKTVSPEQAQLFLNSLLANKEIESGTYQAPEEVLKNFKNWSQLEDAISLLTDNPFPGVITLRPKSAYESPKALEQLTHRLQQLPYIDRLNFDQEGFYKLNAILQLAQALFFILMGLIGIGISVVIANTVRLSLEKHQEEFEVLKLIGASTTFIRRPFLYRGLWYGLIGSALSYILVILAMRHLEPFLQKVAILYGMSFNLELGDYYTVLSILLMGIVLGWMGSMMALVLPKKALL